MSTKLNKLTDTTVREILKGYIYLLGKKGLRNDGLECSCTLDNLIACQDDPSGCKLLDADEDNVVPFKR